MKLFKDKDLYKLLDNGRIANEAIAIDGNTPNFKPVIKLYNLYGSQVWLLTEIDPENFDKAFGLCDLGVGTPELGYISIEEIMTNPIPLNFELKHDEHFKPKYQISTYADKARIEGYIVEDF